MLRLRGSEYSGRTIAEVLDIIAAVQDHGELLNRPYLIVINGELVPNAEYKKVIISDSDFITVMPFIAGG